MATKKANAKKPVTTKTKAPAVLVQGALASAQSAAGRRLLQPGIGVDEGDDLLLALGWPEMIWLVPGDATARELAEPAVFSRTHTFVCGPTPIGVVPRMLRHLREFRKASKLSPRAINDDTPVDDAEAEGFVDAFFDDTYGYVCIMLLEALRSPEWVLERLIARWESVPTAQWYEDRASRVHHPVATFGGGAARAAHFLLLRSDADAAVRLRARLEKLYGRVVGSDRHSTAVEGLDLALHGRVGVERSGCRWGSGPVSERMLTNDVVYALDDVPWLIERTLAYVPTMKPRDGSALTPRLAILGGDPVLEALAANIKGVHSEHREALAIGLTRLRSRKVHAVMSGLVTPTARRWLKEHDD